jgi:N-acetylglucosaminyl-diphospho-decaprenol L-rhamnosyltransferase
MSSLDVAVVIVSYKTAQLTIAAVRSIEAERAISGLQLRVIVVDNASGDAPTVREAVQQNGWSSWVSLVLSPWNGGFAYGNNLGIQRAYQNGIPDYIHLLNPDAQVRPGAITTLVHFLESHPDVGIAGSKILNADGTEWPIAFRFPGLISELENGLSVGLVSRLLRRWIVAREMGQEPERVDWVCGASMMIRPSVIATIGGLDENYFLYFEETDFCYRAMRRGFTTWYVPDSRVMHIRGQSTNVTAITTVPKRLPNYWFDSRRRYFARTFGTRYAITIDIVALVAHSLGTAKKFILNRTNTAVPYFIGDLLRSSVLWRRNRNFPPVRTFISAKADPGSAVT